MNRLLSASAFLCSTLGLVLMILACFLVPHHVVLGDDPGGGGAGGLVDCSSCHKIDPDSGANLCTNAGRKKCTSDDNCRVDPKSCAPCKCKWEEGCSCKE
jgi:hypothetical protein